MGGRHLRPGWGWEGEGRVASVLAEASGASVVCGRTRLFPLPGVFVSYPQERSDAYHTSGPEDIGWGHGRVFFGSSFRCSHWLGLAVGSQCVLPGRTHIWRLFVRACFYAL